MRGLVWHNYIVLRNGSQYNHNSIQNGFSIYTNINTYYDSDTF